MLDLKEIAEQSLPDGLGLFDLKLHRMGRGYQIQIELDGLRHKTGSVSLDECEQFSKSFVGLLDRAIGEGQQMDGSLREANVDLTENNYGLEVSSAGAERQLRLPADLERFKGLPLKIRYLTEEGLTEVVHGVYDQTTGEAGQAMVMFQGYTLTKGAAKKGRKSDAENFTVELNRIEQVNLYLDV